MLGPEPHPYRRIRREADALTLAVKGWRLRFTVSGREVRVTAVASGYRPAEVARGPIEELGPHREFSDRWPPGTAPAVDE
jgi:hypothetical protein